MKLWKSSLRFKLSKLMSATRIMQAAKGESTGISSTCTGELTGREFILLMVFSKLQ